MKRFFCLFLAVTAFCACASRKSAGENDFERKAYTAYKPRPEGRELEILDYSGKNEGQPQPSWLRAWNSNGEAAIEQLSRYSNYYCFVIEQSGANLVVLQKWAAELELGRGISRAVLRRVFNRWTAGLQTPPDIVYGSYFESLILALSAARWPLARREDTRWIIVPGDSQAGQDMVYRMLIFCVLEKEAFAGSMKSIYDSIPFEKNSSRAQNLACEQMIAQFWNGF
jgi:hypothetical protein